MPFAGERHGGVMKKSGGKAAKAPSSLNKKTSWGLPHVEASNDRRGASEWPVEQQLLMEGNRGGYSQFPNSDLRSARKVLSANYSFWN
jgi:hypothetical protein